MIGRDDRLWAGEMGNNGTKPGSHESETRQLKRQFSRLSFVLSRLVSSAHCPLSHLHIVVLEDNGERKDIERVIPIPPYGIERHQDAYLMS